MPSKTEVSERARLAAKEIIHMVLTVNGWEPHDVINIIDRHFAGHEEALELCATVVRWWHNEIPNHPEDRAKIARQAYAALRRAGPVEERK